MRKLGISIPKETNLEELSKAVSFVSGKITDCNIDDGIIELTCEDDADLKQIEEDMLLLAKKYKNSNMTESSVWRAGGERKYYQNVIDHEDFFVKLSDGMVGLNNKGIFLFHYFEKEFEDMASRLGAAKKRYPVLLPMESYKKTGYLRSSPQYAMFCCEADDNINKLELLHEKAGSKEITDCIKKPEYALPSAACFYIYLEHENKQLDGNKVFSLTQSVFRNEGRLNYGDIGRLRDFHANEIVFIGDESFVNDTRAKCLDMFIDFADTLGIYGEINIASDPFVMPKMQMHKKMQMIEKSKYELQLKCSEQKSISVTSFNLHGTAFSHPFHITVKDCAETVTGCIGIGMERWMIAFLCQFGFDIDGWPKRVKDVYYK